MKVGDEGGQQGTFNALNTSEEGLAPVEHM